MFTKCRDLKKKKELERRDGCAIVVVDNTAALLQLSRDSIVQVQVNVPSLSFASLPLLIHFAILRVSPCSRFNPTLTQTKACKRTEAHK